jgi:hypothetical protein
VSQGNQGSRIESKESLENLRENQMKSKRYALLTAFALVALANSVLLLYQPSVRASAGTPPAKILMEGRTNPAHASLFAAQGAHAVYSASVVASLVTQSVEKNILLFEGFAFIFVGFMWRRKSRAKSATAEV